MSIPDLHARVASSAGANHEGIESGSPLRSMPGEVRASRGEGSSPTQVAERLRAQLAAVEADSCSGSPVVRCRRCGLTVGPGTVQQDRVLLFAACCPRCDGPLVAEADDGSAHRGIAEPSIYLG